MNRCRNGGGYSGHADLTDSVRAEFVISLSG
jgi:hypothetical protein